MKGFTLLEIGISLGIFIMLLSLSYIFFWGVSRTDTLLLATRQIISKTHEAQTDTISGKSLDGQEPSSFGIHVAQTSYVKFAGASFNPSASTNEQTTLPPGVFFSQISLPQNNIIFEKVTGKVANFDPNQKTLILTDQTSGKLRTLTLYESGTISYN